MKYLFVLGNNPELSQAEIFSILKNSKIVTFNKNILVLETEKINCQKLIKQLGGTIKIAKVIGDKVEIKPVLKIADSVSGKFKFGFSFYDIKQSNIGMQIKGKLKEKGISSRLVTSKEPTLSSVIITKEKCHDFIVTPEFFAQTCAVQDFEAFSCRDFGRPASDALSGMLPPKLARIMINLSEITFEEKIIDPFCGSGTIIAEALDLGFKKIIGSDLSEKAINDTKKNIDWLIENYKIKNTELTITQLDVNNLSKNFSNLDAIVSEPYLGQPIKGNERTDTIKKIIRDLESLYLKAFSEFYKILKSKGRAVIVIPEWHLGKDVMKMNIFSQIKELGFKKLDNDNLIYKRENQKVWRNITIWEK